MPTNGANNYSTKRLTLSFIFLCIFFACKDKPPLINENVFNENSFEINADNVNIRTGPSQKSKVAFVLSEPALVERLNFIDKKVSIKGWVGFWTHIRYKGRKGWVLSTFLNELE